VAGTRKRDNLKPYLKIVNGKFNVFLFFLPASTTLIVRHFLNARLSVKMNRKIKRRQERFIWKIQLSQLIWVDIL